MGNLRSEIEKTRQQKQRGKQPKSSEDKIKDEIKNKPIKKEEQSLNPHLAKTEKSPQSKPSSKTHESSIKGEVMSRPSIKEKLISSILWQNILVEIPLKVRDENNKIEPIKSNEHINIPKKKSKEQTK